MKVYMFPGQGSQYKGMGKELFKRFPRLIKEIDMILGYSITDLCIEDPEKKLSKTQYTQPALYIINALTFYKRQQESQERISYLIGHSLGEYNALLAAGAFDFLTGLRLVKKRAELMSEAQDGSMAAVLGLTAETVRVILEEQGFFGISIANYNSYTQVVISGLSDELSSARSYIEKAGGKVLPLNVSGAFHSFLMGKSAKVFKEFLEKFSFNNLTIPVIANLNAKFYEPSEITTNLASQINHPVLWTDIISKLLAKTDLAFEEIGPGQVLTGLLQRIRKGR